MQAVPSADSSLLGRFSRGKVVGEVPSMPASLIVLTIALTANS